VAAAIQKPRYGHAALAAQSHRRSHFFEIRVPCSHKGDARCGIIYTK
jgi:hypothetical protein